MSKYQFTIKDVFLWRDFKALAAFEGTTIQAKLIAYITKDVNIFRAKKFIRDLENKHKGEGGNEK